MFETKMFAFHIRCFAKLTSTITVTIIEALTGTRSLLVPRSTTSAFVENLVYKVYWFTPHFETVDKKKKTKIATKEDCLTSLVNVVNMEVDSESDICLFK